MTPLCKLCDAADWFDPRFDRIIRTELSEEPRLHRKQWEFAQIFRVLDAQGFLNGRSRGLSMGGGDERLLYAVARRAGHLTVTDLYDPASDWDGARTNDPDRSLKSAAPFPVDPARLTARRMDMRALEFEDESFDFCYSSCAIEHIGEEEDFLRHFHEVRRVLKEDGVYVLTTEFHYGDDVIPARHNYYFSSGFLHELVRATSFVTLGGVDGTVSPHVFNRPMPANLGDLCADPTDGVTNVLLASAPHVQLLTSGLPFTSICLALAKSRSGVSGDVLPMAGLEDSRRFLAAGARQWKAFVERSPVTLDPYGLLNDRRPVGSTPRLLGRNGDSTLFHTGYVWLGSATRLVDVDLEAWSDEARPVEVELRVHQHPALDPDNVACTSRVRVIVRNRERVRVCLQIAPEDCCSYAVLGKVTSGACWMRHASIQVRPVASPSPTAATAS